MIEAAGLHFSYNGGPLVLRGIDLGIEDGALIGIIGPNGSGKSTLLRCLSGSLRPIKGAVLLEGRSIRGFSRKEVARRISFLGQEAGYGFDYTVTEIVSTGRYAQTRFLDWGMSAQRTAVKAALKDTGAYHLADRRYSELSGGERQRVNIARCLAQGAKTMLLDEPTHDLDIKGSSELANLIRRLHSEMGMTIVAVMHDLNLALRTFPEIVLINDGAILAAGDTTASMTSESLERCFGVAISVDHERGTISPTR